MSNLIRAVYTIKNGIRAGLTEVNIPSSKVVIEIIDILFKEGYILSYRIIKKNGFDFIEIQLKYYWLNKLNYKYVNAITDIKIISKPGRRVYSKVKELEGVNNGLGTLIISTAEGIMTDKRARDENLGGEILIKIN